MYIILIGYLYVVMMFSVVMGSIAKGLIVFFIFGFMPTLILIWLKRGKQIVKERKQEEEDEEKGG
ncbi:MAG: hypothetical protein NT086_02930 [Proteobacteria bacterium]|nr:hypothetical protein [Pseudomonadota bacterium]